MALVWCVPLLVCVRTDVPNNTDPSLGVCNPEHQSALPSRPARPYICGLQPGPTRRPGQARPPCLTGLVRSWCCPARWLPAQGRHPDAEVWPEQAPPPVAAAADGLFCGGARGTLWTPTPAFDIEFLINIYTHSGVRSPHDISPGQTLQIKCLLVKTFSHRGD